MKPATFLGFGALNLDLFYEVDDLGSIALRGGGLEAGEELFGSEEEFQKILDQLRQKATLRSKSGGGSAANTAFALGQMGFRARFIGKAGLDEEGAFVLETLSPVQTDLVRKAGRTGLCLVVLDRRRDRFLFVQGNANNSLTEDDLAFDAIEKSSWVHLSSFLGESPFQAQMTLLGRLDPSVRVSMDPGEIYSKKGLNRLSPLIRRCHIIFLTEKELGLLTGQELARGAATLLSLGPSVVVCKRGAKGARIFTVTGDFEVPARKVEQVDNTGAGDVFNAGFLAGFFLGKPLEVCALFATHVASKSVTGYGRSRYPTKEDLDQFFGLR